MATTTIRHSRRLSIALLAIGIILILGAALADLPVLYILGGFAAVFGVLMLVQPLVEIWPYEVRAKSPGGRTKGTYPVRYPGDLDIHDRKLWHVPTGRRISDLGFIAYRRDVENVEKLLSTSTPEDYHRPTGADQNPETTRYRQPPEPDPFLSGPGWGGAPQNPGGRDAPTPHRDTPPHGTSGEEPHVPFPH
ncbi:hypothetical protein [Flaviflexus huanghaiensis]|uniref:hypothetical protein n=1 Tax=Flaviflexus huanghaiensis TaxID=1111473 RepID=UPI0015F967D7|nr:hypothetical protein [Flaviflexus huanghaiensis]